MKTKQHFNDPPIISEELLYECSECCIKLSEADKFSCADCGKILCYRHAFPTLTPDEYLCEDCDYDYHEDEQDAFPVNPFRFKHD